MIIKNIELDGFRNYAAVACAFDPGVNVIAGSNAQGKTNLLEAVYFLTGARSFRTRSASDVINAGSESGSVRAGIISGGREQFIDIYLSRSERKKIFVNGVRMKTAWSLSGRFCCVLFCPDDLELVKGGAAERRRFMDLAISQLRPKYAELLAAFNKHLEDKAKILRDFRDRPDMLDVLDEFSLNMARCGADIIRYRAAWCARAAEAAFTVHRDISGKNEQLRMLYRTVSTVADPLKLSRAEILDRLLEHQESHRRAEIESGQCLSGVHKDDIYITVNGLQASKFASQGQIRTAALAMKLAEREICYDELGEYPVLLLDDVLSELDPARQEYVLNCIAGGQVLISCCSGEEILRRTGGRIIRIKEGKFV